MREIDFLPVWYPKVRQQRRLLKIQAIGTAAVVLAGLIALAITQKKADAARAELSDAQLRSQRTIEAVQELDEMLALERRLSSQQKIVAELGLPVEINRLLCEVGGCLSSESTLTSVSATTREIAPNATLVDRATGRAPAPTRVMELKVCGVAPTEAEVTAFWTRLATLPFLEQVKLVNTDESTDGDRVMRKFELTFAIRLDFAGNRPAAGGVK